MTFNEYLTQIIDKRMAFAYKTYELGAVRKGSMFGLGRCRNKSLSGLSALRQRVCQEREIGRAHV